MKKYLHRLLCALIAVSLVISLAAGLAPAGFAEDEEPVTAYEVTFDITPTEAELEVTDSEGAPITGEEGVYILVPGTYRYTATATGHITRAEAFEVTDAAKQITVSLDEGYRIKLSATPDPIWTVDIEVGGLDTEWASEGDTVTVFVTKADGNLLADMTGVCVACGEDEEVEVTAVRDIESDENGKFKSGEYTFEMPSGDVEIQLDFEYEYFEIWVRTTYTDGNPASEQLVKRYSKEELTALKIGAPRYYSGYQDSTTPFSARADQAVLLSSLLSDAGSAAAFAAGNTLWAYSADGTEAGYSYTYIYAPHVYNGGSSVGRYYFPQLLQGTPANKFRRSDDAYPMLVLSEYRSTVSDDLSGGAGSGQSSYILAFGMNQTEGNDPSKMIPIKGNVYKLVVEKEYVDPREGLDDWQAADGDGFVTIVNKSKIAPNSAQMAAAPSWNGAIDVSWFNPSASEYYIGTPAQLAGLAALVNGLHNETNYYVGDTDFIRVRGASNDDSDGPNDQNMSTSAYQYGKYNFDGKTVYLTADIDMGGSAQNYMPIGGQYLMIKNDSTTKLSSSFCGTLDGQGHTVYNIYCDRHCSNGNYGDGSSVGLIGRLGVHDGDPEGWRPYEPTVRNLAVSGYIHANRSVGGIVGKIGKTSINNGDGSRGAIIENCVNLATVSNTDAKGCGGIVGAGWNGGLIRNCFNAGSISTTYSCPTGGISGSNEIIIDNCFNVGKISAVRDGYAMAIGTNNGGGNQVKAYWLAGSAPGGGYFGAISSTSSYVLEKTEAYMKSDEFVALLNENAKAEVFSADFENPAQQKNGGFPILAWQGGRNVEAPKGDLNEAQTSADAEVENGVATVTLDDKSVEEMVEILAAGEKNVWRVSMDAQGESYDSAVLELGAQAASLLAKSGITIVADSDLSAVTISAEGLEQLSKASNGGAVSVTVEKGEDGEYKVTLTAGDTAVNVINGGIVITVYTKSSGATVAALIDSAGKSSLIKKSVTDTRGIRMRLQGSCLIRVYENGGKFADVPDGMWFTSYVAFVSSRELMGTVITGFAPEENMTRGMLVTVLHRLEDLPKTDATTAFADMTEGSWYFEAMRWAAENKLMFGVTENEAAPNADITREQLAVIIYRYVKHLGFAGMDAAAELGGYRDCEEVSAWAEQAFAWAVKSGVILGRSADELAPNAAATRAEVAAILQRTITLLV